MYIYKYIYIYIKMSEIILGRIKMKKSVRQVNFSKNFLSKFLLQVNMKIVHFLLFKLVPSCNWILILT